MQENSQEESTPLEIISGTALEQLTRGEIDQQVATAKRYPRSISKFKQKAMEMATLDEETAESCFYNLPRGGKEIKGPSIRMAEIAAIAWTNTRSGARVIGNNGKTVTVQGFCYDLETNTAMAIEVSRRITNKKGETFNEDMQTTTANAALSIALRNAIFKVIPMAYVRPVYEAARRVAIGDATTLVARRAKALDYFAKMGVTPDRVLAMLKKDKPDDINLEDVETMTGLRTALKAGDTTIDEAFPKPEPKLDLGKKKEEPKKEAKTEKKPASDPLMSAEMETLIARLDAYNVTPEALLAWAHKTTGMGHIAPTVETLDQLSSEEVKIFIENLPLIAGALEKKAA